MGSAMKKVKAGVKLHRYDLYSTKGPEAVIEEAKVFLVDSLKEQVRGTGILDENSIEFCQYTDYKHDAIVVLEASGYAMVGVKPRTQYVDIRRRGLCPYCNTYTYESQFHPGTCDNCGGPLEH